MVDLSFLVKIDPGFFERTDATDRLCQWCFLQPACHDHHKKFKKMGGSGRKAKAYIERKENHMDACLVCHEAFHGIRAIMPSGFCCDVCPKLATCRYGCKTLQRPYEHLPEYFSE
jgi:hypothetical protein